MEQNKEQWEDVMWNNEEWQKTNGDKENPWLSKAYLKPSEDMSIYLLLIYTSLLFLQSFSQESNLILILSCYFHT